MPSTLIHTPGQNPLRTLKWFVLLPFRFSSVSQVTCRAMHGDCAATPRFAGITRHTRAAAPAYSGSKSSCRPAGTACRTRLPAQGNAGARASFSRAAASAMRTPVFCWHLALLCARQAGARARERAHPLCAAWFEGAQQTSCSRSAAINAPRTCYTGVRLAPLPLATWQSLSPAWCNSGSVFSARSVSGWRFSAAHSSLVIVARIFLALVNTGCRHTHAITFRVHSIITSMDNAPASMCGIFAGIHTPHLACTAVSWFIFILACRAVPLIAYLPRVTRRAGCRAFIAPRLFLCFLAFCRTLPQNARGTIDTRENRRRASVSRAHAAPNCVQRHISLTAALTIHSMAPHSYCLASRAAFDAA